MNAGSADAAVTVFVQPDEDAEPKSKVFNVPANRSESVSFITEFINELYPGVYKGTYALWYESTAPVSLSYWSEGIGTTYATRAASVVRFADGSIGDGVGVIPGGYLEGGDAATTEEISVFNPSRSQSVTFSLTYIFSDGANLTTPAMSVGPRGRTVAETAGFADVLSKVQTLAEAMQYTRYSITLNASGPVVAQLTGTGPKAGLGLRFGEIGHMGNPLGTMFRLDDPMFG